MRLYVWTNFSRNWTEGLAFAIARDEAEARRLVEEQLGYEPSNWGNLEVRRIDHRVARAVLGGE